MPDDPSKTAAGASTPDSGEDSQHPNRRAVPRYAFIASAEVTDLATEARFAARTSELSVKGCYLDLLNPFPEGSMVRLRILKDDGVFETPGKVLYSHPGFGMGIIFVDLPPAQRVVLERWLAKLAAES